MIGLQRSFLHGVISILIFFFIGSVSAEEVEADADWQSYSNAESRFSFLYPKGWEVVDDFLYKTDHVATLQKIGGSEDANNWIRINPPQFMHEDGRCIEVDAQRICTYSKDADVLNIVERVAASFKVAVVQEDK